MNSKALFVLAGNLSQQSIKLKEQAERIYEMAEKTKEREEQPWAFFTYRYRTIVPKGKEDWDDEIKKYDERKEEERKKMTEIPIEKSAKRKAEDQEDWDKEMAEDNRETWKLSAKCTKKCPYCK